MRSVGTGAIGRGAQRCRDALATAIGIIPGSLAYSIAGEGLDSLILAQQAAHQSCLAKMGPDAEKLCPFVLEPRALLTPGLVAGFVALGLVALCNHSRRPNARVRRNLAQDTLDLLALASIAAGDEVTIDYNCPLWFQPQD